MGLLGRLMCVVVGLPLLAELVVLVSGTDISERHHLHHDTYAVSPVMSRTLVLVMVFMGVLGGLTGWLCHLGVFASDPIVPMGCFVSFQATLLLVCIAFTRYQVMLYDDYMIVRPPYGRRRTVPYADIKSMRWRKPHVGLRDRDLVIVLRGGRRIRLWGLVDVERMLLRIDRFDVLAS